MTICSKKECCDINRLSDDDTDTLYEFQLGAETRFTEHQLQGCALFELPELDKFQLTYGNDYYEGYYYTYWGGEFVKVYLDNGFVYQCSPPLKLTRQTEIRCTTV